jgi:WD40 repeat protein
VAFLPDRKAHATGDIQGLLRLWDVETSRLTRLIPARPRAEEDPPAIRSVAFSPDGKVVAAAGDDAVVRLWDAATGEPLGRFPGHQHQVYSLAFSPDGRRLASASEDATALVWDVARLRRGRP